jgi:hypothetical protein
MTAIPDNAVHIWPAGLSESGFAIEHDGAVVAQFYWSPPFTLAGEEATNNWWAGWLVDASWWWFDPRDPSVHHQFSNSVVRHAGLPLERELWGVAAAAARHFAQQLGAPVHSELARLPQRTLLTRPRYHAVQERDHGELVDPDALAAAELATLARAVKPPPAVPRHNWQTIEERLGLPLPSDYKWLLETYGAGCFDESVWLLPPTSSSPAPDLENQLAVLRSLPPSHLTDYDGTRYRLYPDPGGLLPCACTLAGQLWCWLTDPADDPDHWDLVTFSPELRRWLRSGYSLGELLHEEVLAGAHGAAHSGQITFEPAPALDEPD